MSDTNYNNGDKVNLPIKQPGTIIYALPDAALVEYQAIFANRERKPIRMWFEYWCLSPR